MEDPTLPLVEVTVALLAGEHLDPAERPGLAELTGAMVRRGGTRKLDADTFDERVDALGAEIDARTRGTRAGASLSALVENLQVSLELFFEMLATPGFQPDRLESVKSNVRASLEARNDDPLDVMAREWSWLLAGPDAFVARQLTTADLERLDAADMRAFHRRYWRPERAVIAVSGAVATGEILPALERAAAAWLEAVGEPEDPPSAWPPEIAAREERAGVYLAPHPTPQVKISIGHALAPIEDWLAEEALALEVANEILGGTRGLVSRINGRLRREGWVYRALSEADPGVYLPGHFRIFLDAAPGKELAAIEACYQEIETLRSRPVDERELETVKQELLSALVLRFDTAEEVAGYFAEDLMLGRPHAYWSTYAERLEALTTRDVLAAARTHLRPDKLKILAVGGGEDLLRGGSRNRQLARWLANPHRLPLRDPSTLRPVAASSTAGAG